MKFVARNWREREIERERDGVLKYFEADCNSCAIFFYFKVFLLIAVYFQLHGLFCRKGSPALLFILMKDYQAVVLCWCYDYSTL